MTTIKQPVLMDNFDVEKHPLSDAVWKELEKLYPNQPRSQIYQEHHGKIVPDENREVFQIINGVPKKKEAQPENAGFEQTELGIFLDKIYFIEVWEAAPNKIMALMGQANQLPVKIENYGFGQVGAEDATIEKIITMVNGMPEVEGILELKNSLLAKLTDREKEGSQLGRYEMIIDKKTFLFADFKSFCKDFLRYAKPVLKKGEIPTSSIYPNVYKDFLPLLIVAVASKITTYWTDKKFSATELGILIKLVYFTAEFSKDGYYKLLNRLIYNAKSFDRTDELLEEIRSVGIKLKKELIIKKGKKYKLVNDDVEKELKKIPRYAKVLENISKDYRKHLLNIPPAEIN